MKSALGLVILTAIVASLVTRELFPRTVKETNTVPVIVPKYDTVEVLPAWFAESLAVWKKRKHTTDTLPLLVERTVVDTEFVPVSAPAADRPNLWPVLLYAGGTRFGDTAVVSSFSLRNGNLALSKVFIPGILTRMDADSTGTPKLTFKPFPEEERHNFLYALKMMGIGGGIVAILGSVF